MGVIYVRPNLINGKKYVGLTTDLKKRQSDWNCLTQPYAGPAINAARAKYGIEAFGFEILKECNDNELDYWEKYYIKELNTKAPYGYNLTEGGEGHNGYSPTEETRKKLSEANKGKHLSEETKDKISKSLKGIPNIKLSKPVLQIDQLTDTIIAEYPSIREIERQLGYCKGIICQCCNGKQKSAYGFIWKYAV